MPVPCSEMDIETDEIETSFDALQLEVRSRQVHDREVYDSDEPAGGSEDNDDDDDDDDLEEDEDEEHLVQVGYVQKPEEPWVLARHHFPSKVGGTPVCHCLF